MASSSTETVEATCQQGEATRIPLIGEPAPEFEAVTTQGPIRFPEDFKGKWVILFSHPADFTPVCTTEFMAFASMMPEFETLGCKLVGLSIDSNYSHIAWLRTIKERIRYKDMEGVEVTFPVIADLKMEVARKYGMVQPSADDSHAVRAVFIIDGDARVRSVLYYPISTGRNFPEILRLLVALQTADKLKVATPADWHPGDDVIVPPPGSCGAAQERVEGSEEGTKCLEWFLCLKGVPKEQLDLPPMWK
jgi:peroxiredoxin (alkyl hydroperoxide reductase subunit C)